MEKHIYIILEFKNVKPSEKGNILYIYSKFLSIIHEFKNIKKLYIFLNKVYKFEEIMLNTESIIKAYERQIFSQYKNDSSVTQEIIEIFEHLEIHI